MGFYISVRNTAMKENIRFERIHTDSISDAIAVRDSLRQEYGAIGCHDVKLLLEVKPDPEEDEDIYNDEEILGEEE